MLIHGTGTTKPWWQLANQCVRIAWAFLAREAAFDMNKAFAA
ncbi:hypothetical protein [Alkalilimnicola ehrlichii]|nr:hypothetical protein [Alkalilimnicola ehrlichii]